MAEQSACTRILLAVNQSSIKGYPHPSKSSFGAFQWVLSKLIHPQSRPHFQLLILHVQVSDEDAFNDMDSLYATNEDFRNLKHEDIMRGVHLLQHFVRRCNELEVPCQAWIKKGDPRTVICEEVHRIKPDMLVIGSRGLKTIQRIFVGTVSDHCAKHADCPVLIIRRSQEETPEDPLDD